MSVEDLLCAEEFLEGLVWFLASIYGIDSWDFLVWINWNLVLLVIGSLTVVTVKGVDN